MVPDHRRRLLAIARQVEEQESIIGMSPHMLAVGTSREWYAFM